MLDRSRAPHGARGLKLTVSSLYLLLVLSRPARGAWIEMTFSRVYHLGHESRAPHGARGLKYRQKEQNEAPAQSRPARGAWIEM